MVELQIKEDFKKMLNILQDITVVIEKNPLFASSLKKSEYFQNIKKEVSELKERY